MIPEFEAAEAAVDGATAAPTATTLISSDATAAMKWRLKDRPDIFILPFGGPLLILGWPRQLPFTNRANREFAPL